MTRLVRIALSATLLGGLPQGGSAQAGVPACAFDLADFEKKECPEFEMGGRFMVGKFGEKPCPAGSVKIRDLATCQQAQAFAGFMMETAGAQEGTGDCHFCGGCTPKKVRLLPDYGPKCKTICVKETAAPAAVAPAAQAAPAAVAPAKAAAPPSTTTDWPACQEADTVIRNAGQALFANLQGYGATIGCFLDDCMSTDKFIASEIDSCAKVCHSLPECQYWVWGTEEGEMKCWFRTGDKGREAGEGWVAGKRACAPPGTTVLPLGNSECWAEGFGYPECCEAKYGPNGNAQCWDGVFNYDRCCFPQDEL